MAELEQRLADLVDKEQEHSIDLRSLPNPYWTLKLRGLNGMDEEVQRFLDEQPKFAEMFEDIRSYLTRWLPHFERNNRMYMTVAIGCTGGQHRSVYLVERLGAHFESSAGLVLVRHRELG